MVIEKVARQTLTAVELDCGDEVLFRLLDGTTRRIVVEKSWAQIIQTNLKTPKVEQDGGVTNYRFFCKLKIDGVSVSLRREVSSQESFYEPWELMGMRIWFDACQSIFEFLTETHGACCPRKAVRFAIQDARLGICPVLLHPWCPLPAGGLRIEHCYNGEDVWLGAYKGASAHGGLDINHPAGTPIWAPLSFDDHELFDRLERGANNNRWRGVHRWADGSKWILQVHHLVRLLVPEHQPLEAGMRIADGAGVLIGAHEHSHFVFKVLEPGAKDGDEILLDPWILFWQMYRDRERTLAGSRQAL